MATIKNKNFSKSHLSKANPSNGDTFLNCNFAQVKPHTVIFKGVTGLRFESCNLLNCDIPPDAAKDDCLHLHKLYCSNIPGHKLGIDECLEDCIHKIDSDEIRIDGQLIDKVNHYEDKIVE